MAASSQFVVVDAGIGEASPGVTVCSSEVNGP